MKYLNLKIGDTVLLKEHPGKWEINMIFTDDFDEKHEGKYAAVLIPNTGGSDKPLMSAIKLRDENIKENLGKLKNRTN
jgi:hypothetical protein